MQLAGTFFAIAALVSWGFGDFFIQRTTRKAGIFNALFYIGATGAVLILPFVWRELGSVFTITNGLLLLSLTVLVSVFSALFDFAALKQGKISVVEPILALELPITIGLSMLLLGERFSLAQWLATGTVFVGVMLVMTEVHGQLHLHRRMFERGAILAGVGAIAMALTNFMFGIAARETSPLLTVWFVHSSLAVVMFVYLLFKGQAGDILHDLKRAPAAIAAESLFDNAAWIFYTMAMTRIPIAIATAIGESYIALAVLLGIIVNREKLQKHQFQGIVIAIVGVASLSYLTA